MTKRKYSEFNRHSTDYRPFVDAVRSTFAIRLQQLGFDHIDEHYDDTILCVAFDAVNELFDRLSEAEDE